jgi:hypothetical protein
MKQIINPTTASNTIRLDEVEDIHTKCVLWQSTAKWAPKTDLAKLQRFSFGAASQRFGFAHLVNAASGVCGFDYDSPEAAISAALAYGNVYVFDTLPEAIAWMAQQLK